MKVNFDDKVRTFKALNGEVLRQNKLEILAVARASQILRARVYDVRQAVGVLEKEGVKISDLFENNGKPLTLKTVCIDVLNTPETNERGERKEGWEARYNKGELMKDIWKAEEPLDLKADKISMIKELLAKSAYSNMILHQAFDWLEGEDKPKEAKK